MHVKISGCIFSVQGAITLDETRVDRRPLFDYQFGLTIHPKSESFIQLRPSAGWVVPYCRCNGPCKTCSCITVANRGSNVFTSRGILLPNFPDTQPIVMCTAYCRCSRTCSLRCLSDSVSNEYWHTTSTVVWGKVLYSKTSHILTVT